MNIVLNIFGPVMNLAGVILLFCYGMPYRVRTGGAQPILMEGADQKAVETERWYEWRGMLGLILIVCGTICQIVANVL